MTCNYEAPGHATYLKILTLHVPKLSITFYGHISTFGFEFIILLFLFVPIFLVPFSFLSVFFWINIFYGYILLAY